MADRGGDAPAPGRPCICAEWREEGRGDFGPCCEPYIAAGLAGVTLDGE